MSDKTTDVLQKIQSGEISVQEGEKLLKASQTRSDGMTYKVSPKGAISFYGTRRFPITIYHEELEQLLDCTSTPEFALFLEENRDKLTVKNK